jgi:hypothetical protein
VLLEAVGQPVGVVHDRLLSSPPVIHPTDPDAVT